MVARLLRKRKAEHPKRDRDLHLNTKHSGANVELSNFFDTLSKLFKECPLDSFDDWRSYSYNIIAGRLLYLDFEVTTDPKVLDKLKTIKGFGKKVMKQVRYTLKIEL